MKPPKNKTDDMYDTEKSLLPHTLLLTLSDQQDKPKTQNPETDHAETQYGILSFEKVWVAVKQRGCVVNDVADEHAVGLIGNFWPHLEGPMIQLFKIGRHLCRGENEKAALWPVLCSELRKRSIQTKGLKHIL